MNLKYEQNTRGERPIPEAMEEVRMGKALTEPIWPEVGWRAGGGSQMCIRGERHGRDGWGRWEEVARPPAAPCGSM
jgi:hypothetical protein